MAGGDVPADRAHREFAAFAAGWGGGSPPPANLHTLVRASAKAAGLGLDADAQVLGRALAGARGTALPDGLLDGAAKVFAQAPPPDETRAALAELFAPVGDGGAWLRMLDAAGIVDALASGDVRPDGGLAGWLGRFAYLYKHSRAAYGGVTAQPMPAELYAALPKLAPRLKAEGTPVDLYSDAYRWAYFDADLVDACLAEGVRVEDAAAQLRLWGDRSRRDLRALAADPVFGKRLEGTVHADLLHGTAISRVGPGVESAVHERLAPLLERAAGAPLGDAAQAVAELDGHLDPPTIAALDGIDGALAGLDLAAPLARTLRAGVHAELHWPALDEAVAELGEDVRGVTSTWPVLTVYGRERAIAVDHRGRRGACGFALPEDVRVHSVHYVGGDFLVGWSTRRDTVADEACWASDPAAVFAPDDVSGMESCRGRMNAALGFQFETADGGRYDGVRVLYPGDRDGVAEGAQLTDGTRVWTLAEPAHLGRWTVFDPATGERSVPGAALPHFFTSVQRPGALDWDHGRVSLVRLPDGVTDSPLGQDGALAGFRVIGGRAGLNPRPWAIEGADGRRAMLPLRVGEGRPWGIVRMPAGAPSSSPRRSPGATWRRCSSSTPPKAPCTGRGARSPTPRATLRPTRRTGRCSRRPRSGTSSRPATSNRRVPAAGRTRPRPARSCGPPSPAMCGRRSPPSCPASPTRRSSGRSWRPCGVPRTSCAAAPTSPAASGRSAPARPCGPSPTSPTPT
ncbi:hypothetical protein BJF79_21415 [Actinomadura sp. CNU-125]|uniref:hypothetical protein n=1 Tax=Actinomadura sp. CNU-125 TaxID=1904961 RepID=UPI00095F4BFE|nr:hypothetical protein [Actinomadura sp. CNU-125]OLT12854.1 hypothetical protein BJF79_21415 [Actinomadura sp. CNU-125]